MSVHTKKRLTKIAIGDEEFNVPAKEAKAILFLVKSVERAHELEASIPWDEVYQENFGNQAKWSICLRAARSKANMSQNELSSKTGIPVTTISKYENGEREISEIQAKKLGKALKTNYRIFLTDKGKKAS